MVRSLRSSLFYLSAPHTFSTAYAASRRSRGSLQKTEELVKFDWQAARGWDGVWREPIKGGQCNNADNPANPGYKGSMVGYFAWDTTTLAQERFGSAASDELFAASDGNNERAFPQPDHLISGGTDYIVLTYTQANVSGLTPTMYAFTFKPVLMSGPNAPEPTGATKLHKYKIIGSATGAGSIPAHRWGDYAGAWHENGFFWVSDMLYIGGATPQTGYVAKIVP